MSNEAIVFTDNALTEFPKNVTGTFKIPKEITKISFHAFYDSSLSEIVIPENIKEVEKFAFEACKKLTKVNIKAPLKKIDIGTFIHCNSLKEIILPDEVEYIAESAFNRCENLTSINIPKSLTTIGPLAFQGCKSLKEISLPENLTFLGSAAFCYCNSLKSLTIPKGVKILGPHTINCKNLEELKLEEGLLQIEKHAFNIPNVTSLIIPESVQSINADAFVAYNTNLKLYVSPKTLELNPAFEAQYKDVIVKDSLEYLIAQNKSFKEINSVLKDTKER